MGPAKPGSNLAKARMAAHKKFDLLWKFGHMKRSEAYRWLTYAMEADPFTTVHIVDLNIKQCKQVERLVAAYWEDQRGS